MKDIKVSVIMPCFDEPISIFRKAIYSTINQSFKNFEIIVILDKPDNLELEIEILELIKNNKNIIFIKNPFNYGRSKSRNIGIKKSKGKYIAIHDADDIYLNSKIERQFNFLEKNKGIDLLFTNIFFIDEKDNTVRVSKHTKEDFELVNKYFFIHKPVFCHPSMMVRKKVFFNIEYNIKYKRGQDSDLWMNSFLKGYKFGILEDKLVRYREYYNIDFINIIDRKKQQSKNSLLRYLKNYYNFFNNKYYYLHLFDSLFDYIIIRLFTKNIIKKIILLKFYIFNKLNNKK